MLAPLHSDYQYRSTTRDIPNQNTGHYLQFIQNRVTEHLRLLDHAPSVQMQEIPPDLLGVIDGVLMDDMDEELSRMVREEEEDRVGERDRDLEEEIR
jgi:hypothetical protein